MSISDKIVETFYSKRGTSEQNNPLPAAFPSIQVGVFSLAGRVVQQALFSLFEVCKMLKRPLRANCLNLFCRHVLIIINRIHTICCQYFVLSIVCLYFYAFAGKVSERLLPELRSEGRWESLLCPMKIINKICFSAHLLKNYWKCKNNYLFFQLRTSFHPYKICDLMQTGFATKPSYHLIWERLQQRKDS